jgi:hypothetical protein
LTLFCSSHAETLLCRGPTCCRSTG